MGTSSNGLKSVVETSWGQRKRPRNVLKGALRFCRRKPLGAAGAFIVGAMVFVALFAPWIAPRDPEETRVALRLHPPGAKYLLGTDNLGRDLLSRVIYGARVSIRVGFLSVLLGTTLGALLGLVSGYRGGSLDLVVQRFIDTLMAFPTLVLALALVAMLGQAEINVIIALAVAFLPGSTRIVRSSAIAVKGFQYVEAARAVGARESRIVFFHVLPNCVAPYIIIATAAVSGAILAEATLSFLGLGVPPPTPSWGGMLGGQAGRFIEAAPWMAISPGLALSAAVFGMNVLGDALRDVLDPRLRQGK